MKETMNKIDWKKIGWNALKVLFVVILNTPLWTYLIGSMVPYAALGTNGEFKLSWIDYLRLSDKVEWYHIWLLYIFIVVGIILSVLFIKWMITLKKEEKQHREQLEVQERQTQAIVNAINAKQDKKDKKDIEKYLGE